MLRCFENFSDKTPGCHDGLSTPGSRWLTGAHRQAGLEAIPLRRREAAPLMPPDGYARRPSAVRRPRRCLSKDGGTCSEEVKKGIRRGVGHTSLRLRCGCPAHQGHMRLKSPADISSLARRIEKSLLQIATSEKWRKILDRRAPGQDFRGHHRHWRREIRAGERIQALFQTLEGFGFLPRSLFRIAFQGRNLRRPIVAM